MAGLRKPKKKESSTKPGTVLIMFLVFFILLSIGLGVWGYYGYDGQKKLDTDAKNAKKDLTAQKSVDDYRMGVIQMLANALAELPSVQLNPTEVETNIIIFDLHASGRTAQEIAEHLEKEGVRLSVLGRTKLRAVTHLDVSRQDIERAIQVLRRVL